MDKERILHLIKLYASHVILTVLGLVLVFSPDTAAALVSKIIGWILIAIGVGAIIAAITGMSFERTRTVVLAVLCLGVGIFISSFPLVLAEALGRFFGLILIINGISGIRGAIQKKQAGMLWKYSLGIAIATLTAGVILALLPLTLSRIILNICGAALVLISVMNIVGIYREQKALAAGSRPDVIDAEE